MPGPRTQRHPTFFWQGLLILLPVAVLAVVGVISLQQDKIIARHEARERAQAIADSLVLKIGNEFKADDPGQFRPGSFQVDEDGHLIFPPPCSPVPVPQPLDPDKLNADQARLWATLETAGGGSTDGKTFDRAFQEFIDSNPPANFAAVASYDRGVRMVQAGKLLAAAEALSRVAEKYPDARGESGLPLRPLAQLKLFEILPHPPGTQIHIRRRIRDSNLANIIDQVPLSYSIQHFVSLDTLCSNIVYHPSPVTPYLLTCIQEDLTQLGTSSPRSSVPPAGQQEFVKWQRLWQDHETARRLYAAARPHLSTSPGSAKPEFRLASVSVRDGTQAAANILGPRVFWFATPDGLVVPKPPGQGAEAPQNDSWSIVVSSNGAGSAYASNGVSSQARWTGGGALDRDWLAIADGAGTSNRWYICRSESEVVSRVNELLSRRPEIPDYFGVGFEVAGRHIPAVNSNLRAWHYVGWNSSHSPGGGERKEYSADPATNVLASAVKSEGGTDWLKVNVFLTSPAALYRWQTTRAFWFGLLVAASTVAALIGLWTAWRAFRQQLRLGELKSNFVSSVSHELRAPLASVRLMAENLDGARVPEAQRQKAYFGFIVQECRRLSALIENVLDFSRIEQGRKQYEFEPTDVLALVQSTIRLMESGAVEKGVNLKLETSLAAPAQTQVGDNGQRMPNIELEIDGRAIQQALVNLIDNAIKHSPKGETVTVKLEVRNAECGMRNEGAGAPGCPPSSSLNPRLALSVSDRGPGIPPEEHERIFERFYRRGSELRRETQGVGIGLSIVKHIVEAHGGRVRVESDAGKGSRFIIELPFNPAQTMNEPG